MKIEKLIITLFFAVTLNSCYYDNEEYLYGKESCDTPISFKNDVQPIILQSCATTGCHSDVTSPIFTDYNSISSKANRIVFRTGNGTMPPNGPLTFEELQKISCWVEQGALDN